MAEYLIKDTTLSALGNAIRGKTGKNGKLSPNKMIEDINGLSISYHSNSVDNLPSNAVDGSLATVIKPSPAHWENKSKKLYGELVTLDGRYIWSDGENYYYSSSSLQYILNKETSTWETKVWNGLTSFNGANIWSDGKNINYWYGFDWYILVPESPPSIYSHENGRWVEKKELNIPTAYHSLNVNKLPENAVEGSLAGVASEVVWKDKKWSAQLCLNKNNVWTDGSNIYYSDREMSYKFNGNNWEKKTWSGLTDLYGSYIWSDGENIYYSSYANHYILDKETDTWEKKTWNGLTNFYGHYIWTDGDNIYCSNGSL